MNPSAPINLLAIDMKSTVNIIQNLLLSLETNNKGISNSTAIIIRKSARSLPSFVALISKIILLNPSDFLRSVLPLLLNIPSLLIISLVPMKFYLGLNFNFSCLEINSLIFLPRRTPSKQLWISFSKNKNLPPEPSHSGWLASNIVVRT